MEAVNQMVFELMRQPVVTVGPGATVDDVTTLAKDRNIHHVPIVQHGRLLGIVCTCDLAGARPDLPQDSISRPRPRPCNLARAAPIAQSAERLHGKEKVKGSIPFRGSAGARGGGSPLCRVLDWRGSSGG